MDNMSQLPHSLKILVFGVCEGEGVAEVWQ